MKKTLKTTIIFFLLIFILSCQRKEKVSNLNLDFEQVTNGVPNFWKTGGNSDYTILLDSTTFRSGSYSGFIGYDGDNVGFGSWSLVLPNNYQGKVITLSGYIKTENVTNGFSGLWMRIDPDIAFNNMSQYGVKGTTNWTKYKIRLEMDPNHTKQIVIGGLLVGKGKMWIDDLKLTIDKSDISVLKPYKKNILPYEKDTIFDKGSNIVFPELNKQIISNLELLGKIWGFLKYHHPAIEKGTYNWDYELFRVLPKYLESANEYERDQLLIEWINSYDINTTHCKKSQILHNYNVCDDLKHLIETVYENRLQGEQFYVKTDQIGVPVFLNENKYPEMAYPDQGFRLLALYRYWNIIQYFYPYKYLTDKDWNIVLSEYIPEFLNAKNELEYELSVLKLIGEVNDTHANLWVSKKIDSLRGNLFSSLRVQFVEDQLVVTDYYNHDCKLQIGNIITHIEGVSVEKIVDSLKIFYPASNNTARIRDIAFDLLRSNKPSINIKYISENQLKETKLTLYPKDSLNMYRGTKEDNETCYRLLENNIGYVTLKSIKKEDIADIKRIFKNSNGIIIDIRNYPSSFIVYSLGGFFCNKSTPFAKCSSVNLNSPGEFKLNKPLYISGSKKYYKGKLVVLVNEFSQSQAEFTAMALQAGCNTTIIGSSTAGADGNVSTIWLPGGLKTMISGIGVYYPDGRETQRVGIVPDIIVNPTINGIKNGKDEILEKAIEFLQNH